MNEFEKDMFDEFETVGDSTDLTENKDTFENVTDNEESFETSDYVTENISFENITDTKEDIPKFKMKKYIAIGVVAAFVNIIVLMGIFSAGYHMGQNRYFGSGKNAVIEGINSQKTGTKGAKTTIETGQELSTVEISKRVGPSVVGITSTKESAFSIFGTTTTSEGSGSGIIFSNDGYCYP